MQHRYTTSDPSLLAGWKLADKNFATDDAGTTPAGGGAGPLFHKVPIKDGTKGASSSGVYMINMDTGSTFAVGKYDTTLEKLHLRSNATSGVAIREWLDYSRATYKWATTGLASDGRLLTIGWVDEGECAEDSPRDGTGRSCNGMRHRSVLSLPREILWDLPAEQLVSRPVAEIASLRNASFLSGSAYILNPGERQLLTEVPETAGGALDLEVSFDLAPANSNSGAFAAAPSAASPATAPTAPHNFGLAVRASRWSLDGAAVELIFNVSAAAADGSRTVSVADVATPKHLLPLPTRLSRWMNDTDLPAGDYATSHHLPSSGDTAKTCQMLCDADPKCAAWVWVVRGTPAGAADCCLKNAAFACPGTVLPPHPCTACALTAGVKVPGTCTSLPPAAMPVNFEVVLLKDETTLDVRVLVDRPVVEVFVQGGRGAFVAVSNFSETLASVHLLNRGAAPVHANVSAYGMGCGWAAILPVPKKKELP